MKALKRKLAFLFLLSIGFLSSSFYAEKETQYKLIVFSGSDWCSNCIRFEKNILSDTSFLEKAQQWNIEVEKIDFPQRKKLSKEVEKYNASIAEKYKFEGVFPTIIITNTETNSFREINYQSVKTTQEFLEKLEPIISENQL